MIKKIVNYVKDERLSFKYFDNGLNVVNYDKIVHINDQEIVIAKDKMLLTIRGTELILKKLLEQELLIKGIIKSIEM